jgi:hypothetical protein
MVGAAQRLQQSCNGGLALGSVVLERMTEGEELRVFATQADELLASDRLSGSMVVVRGTETVLKRLGAWRIGNEKLLSPLIQNSDWAR